MKNGYIMLAIVASAITFNSCSSDKDELNNNSKEGNLVEKTFVVSTENSQTRAILTNSTKTTWESGDLLAIYGNNTLTANKFTYKNIPNPEFPNYAYFDGTVNSSDTKFYVLYPFEAGISCNTSAQIEATIPTQQTATSGSFDPKAALSAGASTSSTDPSIELKHVCAFFKIKVNNACKDITIVAKNNSNGEQYLAGGVTINAKSGGSAIDGTKFLPTATNTVKLVPESGTSFAAGTYYIAVVPSTDFPGATVTVNFANGTTKSTDTNNLGSVSAAYIYNLGEVSEGTATN